MSYVKSLKPFFKLIVNRTEIHYFEEEPVNWDKVNIIVKRDTNYFGVNYQYTDGSVQLEFYKDCLGDVIREVFDRDGTDGDITLQYGYLDGAIEVVDFEGKLDLNLYKRTYKGNISCTIDTTGFHTLLSSRIESTVDLFDTKTLDGATKTIYPAIDLTLHSKIIKRQTVVLGNDSTYNVNSQDNSQAKVFFYTYDFPNAEDTGNQACEYGGDGLTVDPHNPSEDAVYLATITEMGDYKFDFDLQFDLTVQLGKTGPFDFKDPSFESWTNTLLLYHFDSLGVLKNQYAIWANKNTSSLIVGKESASLRYHIVCSHSINDMQVQDKIIVFGHMVIDGQGDWSTLSYRITTRNPFPDKIRILTITAMTVAPDTNSKAYLVHEAIQNVVESITGNRNSVKSDYFGRVDLGYPATGEGGNYAISNGFMIRNFINTDGTPKRQLKITFKELMSSLRAIFGVGIGYEYDNRGNQIIRVEPLDYFYQDNEILIITDCSEYSDEVMKENIYNEILVGYKKYPEPSYSGDETSKSGVNLLDEFLTQLDFNTPIKTNQQKFEILSELIASGFAIEETRRAQFSTDKNNSTTYDDNNFIISVVKSGTSWKSEKGSDAFTFENVISGDTAYNMRITPKRNLMRWSSWINGGLAFCKATDILKNASYVMNGFFKSKKTGETSFTTEKEDIVLADYGSKNHFAKPISITFKCRLDIDAIRIIKDAYTGKATEKNGYISVMNDEREKVSGYLYDMTYSPVTEQVTLKLMKRDAVNNEGCDCNDFADWTSLDFKTKPYPKSIKECLTEVFHHSN